MDRTFVLAMSCFVPYPMRSSFSAINSSCDILFISGQNVVLRR